MPAERRDADGAEAGHTSARSAQPLPQRREKSRAQPSAVREEIMAATLVAAGEIGYRQLSVKVVLERYGGNRVQFYRHFENVGECYAAAYAVHSKRLERRLLAACAAAERWRDGLRAALAELTRFACEDPELACGLVIGGQAAGDPVAVQREEVMERLSRAIDSARRETESRHSPPPLTAIFIVSAVESIVARALLEGRQDGIEATMAELEPLISTIFYGL